MRTFILLSFTRNLTSRTVENCLGSDYFHINYKGVIMKRAILFTLITISLLFAQREAGDYDRSSLTYIDRLFAVDQSVKKLPEEYENSLIQQMSEQLNLPRYDQNQLPQKLITSFENGAHKTEYKCEGNLDQCLNGVTDLMNEIITPPILEVVEMNRDIRATERMTDQQRNSFITDKARELGFTAEEVRRVMNSAYIFMPYGSNYIERTWLDTTFTTDSVTVNGRRVQQRKRTIIERFSTKMRMGLVWWKIIPETDSTESELRRYEPLIDSAGVVVELSRSVKINNQRAVITHKPYRLKTVSVTPQVYARTNMITSLGTDFGQRLRDFDDFRLSGQILERSPNFVGMDMGSREGINLDDIFWTMETVEENGKTVSKKAGWVMVRNVADSNSAEGYKSRAQIIAGRPYIGAVLQEQPMSNGRASFQIQSMPYTVSSPAIRDSIIFSNDLVPEPQDTVTRSILTDLKLNNGTLFRLEFGGRIVKFPQLYLMLGAGFSVGDAEGTITASGTNSNGLVTHEIEDVIGGHYDLSLLKRFSLRRVSLSLQTGAGFQHFKYNLDEDIDNAGDQDASYRLSSYAIGGFSNLFADISITPSLAIGGGVGYRYFGSSSEFDYTSRLNSDDKWQHEATIASGPTVDQNGMTISAYVTYRPSISLRGN